MTTGLPFLRRRRRGPRSRGQSLAEFALVFPWFMMFLFGVVEFGFLFNATLSLDFATREAALAAAESGNLGGSDCSILRVVERSVSAPADRTKIGTVAIFKAKPNGDPVSAGARNVYTRTADTNVQFVCPDGTGKVPYRQVSVGYNERTRCNELDGCGISGQTTVDTIGVEMGYRYEWKTPILNFVPSLTDGGVDLKKGNAMRMEPVL